MSAEKPYTLWIEHEQFGFHPDERPYDFRNEMSNIKIKFADGRSYAYSVYTFDFVHTVRMMDRAQNGNLAGLYMFTPDLLIDNLERSMLETMVDYLIAEDWLTDDDE